MLAVLRGWPARRWLVALAAAVALALALGLPTDVVPNPVFGRPVAVTWWAPWVLVASAALGGLVVASYVRDPAAMPPPAVRPRNGDEGSGDGGQGPGAPGGGDRAAGHAGTDPPARLAGVAGLLGFFAVGCPVCNKLVVVALGTTGALQWFAPLQPVLAVASVVALAVALRARLAGQLVCAPGRRATV